MTCDRKAISIFVTNPIISLTCLNCSSNVQDPPRSLLPVDWGVGG